MVDIIDCGLHRARDNVHVTDEVSDVDGIRCFVDTSWRRDLDDLPFVHHSHAARDGHRFLLVVGNDNKGGPCAFLDIH